MSTQNSSAILKMIIQIYEIQSSVEAQTLVDMGVDHIGSVLVSETQWMVPELKETLEWVRSSPAKSSLIPLFNALDSVLRTIAYYRPDIIHFCEALTDRSDLKNFCRRLMDLQQEVKMRFPDVSIMRSIPIAEAGAENPVPTLELAGWFEPYSDFFLTDTLLVDGAGADSGNQPVQGFVGITGKTCNWDTARRLVSSSRIPVILAGWISPANVADGIAQVKPAGVDSCTMTNAFDEDGRPIRFRKDLRKVRQLVYAVRKAEVH
jgi:phosphoribosylanthranilate isomerase